MQMTGLVLKGKTRFRFNSLCFWFFFFLSRFSFERCALVKNNTTKTSVRIKSLWQVLTMFSKLRDKMFEGHFRFSVWKVRGNPPPPP